MKSHWSHVIFSFGFVVCVAVDWVDDDRVPVRVVVWFAAWGALRPVAFAARCETPPLIAWKNALHVMVFFIGFQKRCLLKGCNPKGCLKKYGPRVCCIVCAVVYGLLPRTRLLHSTHNIIRTRSVVRSEFAFFWQPRVRFRSSSARGRIPTCKYPIFWYFSVNPASRERTHSSSYLTSYWSSYW